MVWLRIEGGQGEKKETKKEGDGKKGGREGLGMLGLR